MTRHVSLHELAGAGEVPATTFEPLASRVLSYQNPELVERLKRKMSLSQDEAEELFMDMKKFLLLCGLRRDEPLVPTKQVDEAWHHFILYTQDYAAFCEDMFGEFIHHVPNSYFPANRAEEAATTARTFDATLALAHNVFGELGENWAKATSRRVCFCPRAKKRPAAASPAGCAGGWGPAATSPAGSIGNGCLHKCFGAGPARKPPTTAAGGCMHTSRAGAQAVAA